jgi:ribonuclease BN (tRNA processing enzyme)
MKLTLLGSCSGTEPMPNRKHTAFVIEHEGGVYWFDAGEGCSHTAHLLGIDVLAIRALFISHPHLDHVGGLVNLLGTIRKLEGRNEDPARSIKDRTIPVRIPNMRVWQGALDVLMGPAESLNWNCTLDVQTYQDGVIFDHEGLKVTALHNRHLGDPPPGAPWQSFSFRIETASAAIVFSGDVKHVSEVAPLIDEGCDLFLMETGHHLVEEVCTYLLENGVPFGELGFVHHGRAILADPEGECKKARNILGNRVFVADDEMVKTL